MSTHESTEPGRRHRGPTAKELDQEIRDIAEEFIERFVKPTKAVDPLIQRILDDPQLVVRIVHSNPEVYKKFRGHLFSLLYAVAGITDGVFAPTGPKPRAPAGRHRRGADLASRTDSILSVNIPTWRQIQDMTYRQVKTWVEEYGAKIEKLVPAYQLMLRVLEQVGVPDDWDRKVSDLLAPPKFARLKKQAGYK